MINLILALICLYWFKQAFNRFPNKINRQVWQDFNTLQANKTGEGNLIRETVFKQQSQLQPKSFKQFYLMAVLFLIIACGLTQSLFVLLILFILIYLAFLDGYYYLTDVQYIAAIFLLAIAELLFHQPLFISEKLWSFLLSTLFLLAFSFLLQRFYRKETLGFGDILLLSALSPLFSLEQFAQFLLIACLTGLTYACLIYCITRKPCCKLPFIPFITFSAVCFLGGG